jgi:uncharacterized protein (TIGR02145 family)
MGTLFKIGNKILKIGNKILTVSDSPIPSLDYVIIGSQIWTSKNLSIDDGQGGIYTQTVNYGQGDVVEYYYTWDAAVRLSESVSGWHLPSIQEFAALANAVGGSSTAGTKLKSTYGWENDGNGTDDYGFSVFPAGAREMGSFEDLGIGAYFWTSTSSTTSSGARRYVFSTAPSSYAETHVDKSICCSVRLVKDSE